ncbi:MAG: MBL fold metallo-hydrolase [Alphaproteobacteria bacterium]|nr:MBL fold metallo-hydrolase [Alphaproteobacteria bacterium]
MSHVLDQNLNYDRPIKLADGVFWVGYNDPHSGLQCNPYLIFDGDEAVLIDGGSRPDFSTVMRKVLQVGVEPRQISHLIYQHYDPDLCGSIPNFENIIGRPDLKLISKQENIAFIRHYSVRSEILCMEAIGRRLVMKSGRALTFHATPYAHLAGSFTTYDTASGILFSSDLFGSVGDPKSWRLFLEIERACAGCAAPKPTPDEICGRAGCACPWTGFAFFHRQIMPCNKAVRYAMDVVRSVGPKMIAPQHGSVLHRPDDIAEAIARIAAMEDVGIDGVPAFAGA